MPLLDQVSKNFFPNFLKFPPSDKKICKKNPLLKVSNFCNITRRGINLKLCFSTLLKSICCFRDTAYRKWAILSRTKQLVFKSVLNKSFRSIPSLNNIQFLKKLKVGIFFNKFFSSFFPKKNLNFYNHSLSVLFTNILSLNCRNWG